MYVKNLSVDQPAFPLPNLGCKRWNGLDGICYPINKHDRTGPELGDYFG